MNVIVRVNCNVDCCKAFAIDLKRFVWISSSLHFGNVGLYVSWHYSAKGLTISFIVSMFPMYFCMSTENFTPVIRRNTLCSFTRTCCKVCWLWLQMISYFYVGCCKVLLFKTLRLTKLNKLLLTYLLTWLWYPGSICMINLYVSLLVPVFPSFAELIFIIVSSQSHYSLYLWSRCLMLSVK